MKKILEKIKDIMYDSFDYVIMLVIVLVVVAIIGWRLDVLFTKDVDTGSKGVKVEDVVHNEDNKPGDEEDDEEPKVPEAEETVTEVPPVVEAPPVVAAGEKVKVTIPAGSLPGKIGSILADSGVISSSRDFIAKAVELKLDTKLKSGTFYIPQGSTHEEILRIITK